MALAALGAIVLRLKGSSGGSPSQAGRWRELAGDDLR
jgi:hypothetical protein